MTTMLSLILAFMLSIGGSPAASVNPAGCPGDTGIQTPIDNNRTINRFFEDYREKTASRPISKKNLEIPLIKQPETQIRFRFSLYVKEELRLVGYMDSMNLYQAFGMNPVNFNDPMGAAIDSPTRFTRYRYNPNAGFWGLTWEGSSKGMYDHGGEAFAFGVLLTADAISVPFDKAFDLIDWAAQKTGVAQFFGFKPGETKAVLSLGLLLASGQPQTAMVGTATGASLSRIKVFGKYFGKAKNFLKKLSSKITAGKKRLLNPTFEYADDLGPNTLGATNAHTGEIYIKAGLKGEKLTETLRHEAVHKILTPKVGKFLSKLRSTLRIKGYEHSHLLRYLEEALAEAVGTKNILKGLKFPLKGGYDINKVRLLMEGGALTTAYGLIWYFAHKLTSQEEQSK